MNQLNYYPVSLDFTNRVLILLLIKLCWCWSEKGGKIGKMSFISIETNLWRINAGGGWRVWKWWTGRKKSKADLLVVRNWTLHVTQKRKNTRHGKEKEESKRGKQTGFAHFHDTCGTVPNQMQKLWHWNTMELLWATQLKKLIGNVYPSEQQYDELKSNRILCNQIIKFSFRMNNNNLWPFQQLKGVIWIFIWTWMFFIVECRCCLGIDCRMLTQSRTLIKKTEATRNWRWLFLLGSGIGILVRPSHWNSCLVAQLWNAFSEALDKWLAVSCWCAQLINAQLDEF